MGLSSFILLTPDVAKYWRAMYCSVMPSLRKNWEGWLFWLLEAFCGKEKEILTGSAVLVEIGWTLDMGAATCWSSVDI